MVGKVPYEPTSLLAYQSIVDMVKLAGMMAPNNHEASTNTTRPNRSCTRSHVGW